MKVNEVRPESKVDVIELTIREKGAAREFSSRGGSTGKVCDAKAVDDDGSEVSVSLWNEEIDRVQPNDRIRITNGWAREWRGNIQAIPRNTGTTMRGSRMTNNPKARPRSPWAYAETRCPSYGRRPSSRILSAMRAISMHNAVPTKTTDRAVRVIPPPRDSGRR